MFVSDGPRLPGDRKADCSLLLTAAAVALSSSIRLCNSPEVIQVISRVLMVAVSRKLMAVQVRLSEGLVLFTKLKERRWAIGRLFAVYSDDSCSLRYDSTFTCHTQGRQDIIASINKESLDSLGTQKNFWFQPVIIISSSFARFSSEIVDFVCFFRRFSNIIPSHP